MKNIRLFRLTLIIPICFVWGIFFSLTACKKQPAKPVVVVGVNQFAQHVILDAVYQGLRERLEKEGIKVDLKVANADISMVHQINNQFLSANVDVIVPLGTPSAQSAVNLSTTVPIVFGAITDPVAAKLADSMEKPGGNKTGTTNRWPFDAQVSLIRKLKPDAKKIGILVNPGEENCVAGMKHIEKALNDAKLPFVEVSVSNTSEILAAVQSLVGKKVDVILVSPSNVVVSGASAIVNIAQENKILLIGGDKGTVQNGSLATYGYDNVEIGRTTAELVLRILREKINPGDIPVAAPPTTRLYINLSVANKTGVKIPEELVKAGNEIF